MIDGMFWSIGDPGRKRHHLAGIPGDGRLHKAKPFTARQPSKGRPFVNAFRHAGRCPCLYFIRTRRKIPARDALRVGGFIEEAGMSDLQAVAPDEIQDWQPRGAQALPRPALTGIIEFGCVGKS